MTPYNQLNHLSRPNRHVRHSMAMAAMLALISPAGHAQSASPEQAQLQPDSTAITIIGSRLDQQRQPGSTAVVDEQAFENSRAFTVNEVLRKLPGVHVRDEEGFGLRPNISVRGLNPTRSTKVTLLEDGVPLAYAPYGDNASYYFPPVDRFTSVELVKGVGTLAYGPQTIGGVINFRTPMPARRPGGFVELKGGSRKLLDAKVQASLGDFLFDATRKRGDGARDNTSSELTDLNVKGRFDLGGGHLLTAKLSHFIEDSVVTYSGLTEAELTLLGPRYNPFKNDAFEITRTGGSLTHRWAIGGGRTLTTQAYAAYFDRDWWRQSSTTTDGQCGAAFSAARLAGRTVDVNTCNSNQGRLRAYVTYGLDSRLSTSYSVGGVTSLLDIGVKLHDENQKRLQVNTSSPTGRTGTVVENNIRDTRAYAAFVSNRIEFGENVVVTPIVRYESIENRRENRLTGRVGSDTLSEWIPGIGASWKVTQTTTLFAGVHRGFAPPRTEDIIDGNGTSTEVGAERSLNTELGLRTETLDGMSAQVTLFNNRFDRLIAVGSIAGGSTPLAEGEATFRGLELSGSWYPQAGALKGWFSTAALTWLPTAEQTTAFRQVVNGNVVAGSVAGNRQPYAPERLATVAVGYDSEGWMVQLEGVHTSQQFSDFANTVAGSANGQAGIIGRHTIFNVAGHWSVNRSWLVYATVKNLQDDVYIVDRARGIQVGQPRLVQVGVRARF
jgi:Fe(3+) dicitrate transport protein